MNEETPPGLSPGQLAEERAFAFGTTAVLWGFTLNELYRVRSAVVSRPGGGVNRFFHRDVLLTPEQARKGGVVRSNSATLYSSAWLDLSVEPIVLDLPPIPGRYFTFNYVDFYQRNENLSNVTVGRRGGAYAFVGPNWKGPVPNGVQRVDVATDTIWIVGRLEVRGPDDVTNVHDLQAQLALTSLDQWIGGQRNTTGDNIYPEWPPYDLRDPLDFFAALNVGLRHNPPRGADLAMLGLFESLDIGPNKTFDPAALDPATAAGLRRAVEIGPQILQADFTTRLGQNINGWQITTNLGSWITPDTDQLDFLLRSAIAKGAQPGQQPAEAIYPMAFAAADGDPLTGDHDYVLCFLSGGLPPVDAFWSVALYDADGFAIDNPIHRTQIGTYDDLAAGPDGSLTIYIQHDTPGTGNETNWLLSPGGSFNLAMRLHNPQAAALTLDWTPPGVERSRT